MWTAEIKEKRRGRGLGGQRRVKIELPPWKLHSPGTEDHLLPPSYKLTCVNSLGTTPPLASHTPFLLLGSQLTPFFFCDLVCHKLSRAAHPGHPILMFFAVSLLTPALFISVKLSIHTDSPISLAFPYNATYDILSSGTVSPN